MEKRKSDLFDAIGKCLNNAQELFEEGEILNKNNRFSRSYTLFQFCIEEVGKAGLIYNLLLRKDISDISVMNKFYKEFRDHKKKISASINFDKMLEVIIEDEDLKESWIKTYTSHSENINTLNDKKNLSLYISVLDNKFYLPSEFINQNEVIHIKFHAEMRLTMAKKFHTIALTKLDEF